MARFRSWRSSAEANGATESRQGFSPRAQARVKRASDPATGRRDLCWLALCYPRHPAIARALVANPALPPGAARLLSLFSRWDVVAAIAASSRCPGRLQWHLALHNTWAVRAAIAANPAARPDVLRHLVDSEKWQPHVAMYAATNPALDGAMTAILLRHSSPYVRAVAAANPAAPPEALTRLATDMTQPAWVLRAAAANPACPGTVADQTLTWLALGGPVRQDPSFDPLTCTGHPADTSSPSFNWYALQAQQPGARTHPLWRVRAAIPRSLERVPIEVATDLCQDPRPEVRRAAARLLGIPPRIAREMTNDADPVVASTASSGRKTNRRRAWKRRGKRAPRLLARIGIPVALMAGGLTYTLQQPSSDQTGLPAASATSVCAFSVLAANAKGVETVSLPGGGFISCLAPTDAIKALVTVQAGTVGVTIRAPGSIETASGVRLVSPEYVAADQSIVLAITLPAPPVAFASGAGDSPVIRLVFRAAKP
jgi:hypothetical protein